jgi:hypothetical protein
VSVRRFLRRRPVVLVAVWTVPSLVFLLLTSIVYFGFRIDVPSHADAGTRTDAMAIMRAALDGAPVPAPGASLRRELPDGGPVIAVVYLDGLEVARAVGYGATWADALVAAAGELGKAKFMTRDAETRTRARIRIDAVVGRGPLPGSHALFDTMAMAGVGKLLALNPGLDGIAASVDGKEVVLVPHDLIAATEKVMPKKRPIKMGADFAVALELAAADRQLVRMAGSPPNAKPTGHHRIRVDSFAERAVPERGQPPVSLYRDNRRERPPLTAKTLRDAALEGGRYLVAHLGPNGRYVYNHNLNTGVATDPMGGGDYSIPRHAGTTYFLAELYRITKEEFLREPIERAFSHLDELVRNGGCNGTTDAGAEYSCVIDRGDQTAVLGSTALAVVALAEYQRATDDTRFLDLATRLTNWLLFMQRPDGTFRYRMDVRTKQVNEKIWEMYYAGETALAFARMHVVTGDAKYADAAGRAIDQLVTAYDFFLGGFFYGEEHWTCIASEAAFPAVKRDKYREFCNGYAAFLRQQQAAVGEYPDADDLSGAYNTPPTPFVMPWNTPAGSRTEAMISAYLLGVHHGQPEPEIRAQIMAALHYTLNQVVGPDTDYAAAGSLRVQGAMPGSPVDRVVRIDYVQHVCSAMIRASAMMDEGK